MCHGYHALFLETTVTLDMLNDHIITQKAERLCQQYIVQQEPFCVILTRNIITRHYFTYHYYRYLKRIRMHLKGWQLHAFSP